MALLLCPCLLAFNAAGTTEEPTVAEDEFVASCIGIGPDFTGDASICVASTEDGSYRILREGNLPSISPALSADRRLIAFQEQDGITIVTADGREFSTIERMARSIEWLPDNDTLVLLRVTSDRRAVVETRSATTAAVGISHDIGPAGSTVEDEFAVSPSGTEFAYAYRQGDQSTLAVCRLDTGECRDVFHSKEFIDSPDWAPTGSLVAAVVDHHIEVVDVVTGTHEVILENNLMLATPSWSPEGDRIVMVEARGAPWIVDVTDPLEASVILDISDDYEAQLFPARPQWT